MNLPKWVKIVRLLGFVIGVKPVVISMVFIAIGLAKGASLRSMIPHVKASDGLILVTLLLLPWRCIKPSPLYTILAIVYAVVLTQVLTRIMNGIRDVLAAGHVFSSALDFVFLLLMIVSGIILIAQLPALWVIRRHLTTMRHHEQHPTDTPAK